MPKFEQNQPASPEDKKQKFVEAKTEYDFEKERGPKWEAGAETSSSEDHPEHNEDAFFVDSRRRVAGIFDGMGGVSGGEVASREAGDILGHYLKQLPERATSEKIREDLVLAMTDAHNKILEIAQRRPGFKGMGTTASIGKIVEGDGKRKLVYAHIGDSRIYIAHGNGSLEQVTSDDGYLNSAMEAAKKNNDREAILKFEKVAAQMDEVDDVLGENVDPDLCFFFINRNIIEAGLGLKDNFVVKTGEVELRGDEVVLFTSDGIHDNLSKTKIAEIIKKYHGEGAQRISEALVEAANEVAAMRDIEKGNSRKKRPKHDDKTAVVLMEEIPEITSEEIGMEEI